MSRTVYVVMFGEMREGGKVQGVFSTHEAANEYCYRFMHMPDTHPWEQDGADSWFSGSDTLEIMDWVLDDPIPVPD